MAKFVVYEKVTETVYNNIDKASLSDAGQTGVNLGSGLMAGFAAAIVSQPADTMLSKINKTKGLPGEGTTSRLIKIAKELGIKGSYTGLGARLFMGLSSPPRDSTGELELTGLNYSWDVDRWSVRNLRRHQEGSRCRWRCRDWEVRSKEKKKKKKRKSSLIGSVVCSCFYFLFLFFFLLG